ncbi:MAG: nuclear transport factor 2 family protein [Cyanobacteria bacterium]|nr:nuclear transport factor 2 family protein [Cyanobacteriota bacterium]
MLKGLMAALLLMAAPVSAQPAIESVKTELRAFITELNAALAARDREAIERLYAAEFLYIHTNGPPTDRAAHIAETMATKPRGAMPIPSLDNLIVVGDVAILRDRVADRFGTTIYAKRNGRWQVLQLQGTALPSTIPAAAVSPELLAKYAGRYQQDNDLVVIFTVEGANLNLQVEGRQKFVLTTVSATEFAMPGDTARIRFAPDGSYEFHRANQPIRKGKKQ